MGFFFCLRGFVLNPVSSTLFFLQQCLMSIFYCSNQYIPFDQKADTNMTYQTKYIHGCFHRHNIHAVSEKNIYCIVKSCSKMLKPLLNMIYTQFDYLLLNQRAHLSVEKSSGAASAPLFMAIC